MTQAEFSAAAERNKLPILEVLCQVLPAHGYALEIASGTGQHVAWFAAHMPGWTWQPSDPRPEALESIEAYRENLSNVLAPQLLDVIAAPWWPEHAPVFDLIYCANMLHIAPWAACAALMRGSSRHLAPDGILITYGPYLEEDVPTAPGNLEFDESLRARNPAWGIRQREAVEKEAKQAGLKLSARHVMPVNNLMLVWTRGG